MKRNSLACSSQFPGPTCACSVQFVSGTLLMCRFNVPWENGLSANSQLEFGTIILHCLKQLFAHLLRLYRGFFFSLNPRVAIIHVPLSLIRQWSLWGPKLFLFFYSHHLAQSLDICLWHWSEMKWYQRNCSADRCCHHHVHSHYGSKGIQPTALIFLSGILSHFKLLPPPHIFEVYLHLQTQVVFVTIYAFNYQ